MAAAVNDLIIFLIAIMLFSHNVIKGLSELLVNECVTSSPVTSKKISVIPSIRLICGTDKRGGVELKHNNSESALSLNYYR